MSTNDPDQPPVPPVPPVPADDQPTVPFVPTDDQPTLAYPSTPDASAPAYGAPQPPAYGAPQPPAYGDQPAYGAAQPSYGAPQPTTPDTRPKRLGWIALGVGIGGLILALAGFVPILWVGLVLALIGGLLLLISLVLGIVTLASKKQGGKGLGIAAIVVSVLGGAAWSGALVFSLVLIGLATAGSSSGSTTDPLPSVSADSDQATDEGTTEEDTSDGATGTYDEAAFLAELRPQITGLMQEIEPNITEEMISSVYTDEMLVATGKSFLMTGESARDAFISASAESSGGVMSEDQAARFFDAILGAAQAHLVE